jgi:hypothetical protein
MKDLFVQVPVPSGKEFRVENEEERRSSDFFCFLFLFICFLIFFS